VGRFAFMLFDLVYTYVAIWGSYHNKRQAKFETKGVTTGQSRPFTAL